MPIKTPAQIPLNLRPELAPDYLNFLKTPANANALAMVRAWPNWTSAALFLLGPEGSGKTHLGQAWARETGGVFWDAAEMRAEDELFAQINLALSGQISGLILASQTPPAAWKVSMPDLRSRLGAMPIAQLSEMDDGSLEIILRALFAQLGREVSQDVVSYLLIHADRSVSELRQLTAELDFAAGAAKADITKHFAAKFLRTR